MIRYFIRKRQFLLWLIHKFYGCIANERTTPCFCCICGRAWRRDVQYAAYDEFI